VVGLSLIAGGASVAWRISHGRNRRARERLRRAESQAAALLKLSSAQSVMTGDLPRALREIAETARPVLGVARVCVSLMDGRKGELRCAEVYGRLPGELKAADTLTAAECPGYFRALREARVIEAADARNDERTRELTAAYLEPHGINSVLDAPVRTGGGVVASVRFEHCGAPRTWREDEVGFAAAVADQVAQAMLAAERERAHRELRESEERFRLVVEAAPSAMLMVAEDGRIALANAQAERVFGYARDELVGMNIERLMPARHRNGHRVYTDGFFGDAKVHPTGAGSRLFGLRRDGTEFPVEVGLSPIRHHDRSFVLSAIVDMTARVRAEAEVQQQRVELAHLSRVAMLGELSGSLAHELNQPLTAILSNAQAAQRFIAKDDVDLDEVREILKDIVDEDKRAGEVIRRLRLLLKKGEVNRQPLDMNEVVLEVLKLVRSDLVHHEVSVETDLWDGLPQVSGDRVQLQQVLLNLVMNACDAVGGNTRDGDRSITVRTRRLADGSVRTTVTDRGSGIAPDRLERVFDPFFTTKAEGMGLGLAVCRTIVAAHGGNLSAENNHGRGASFNMTLAAEGAVP
jgi:two-component system sensor kinase FixL